MTPPVFLLFYAGLLVAIAQHPKELLTIVTVMVFAKLLKTL
jgi:hypothetical protein